MYSLLNLQLSVQNTVLSLGRHFCPPIQSAFSSRFICLREVNIPHVATLNTPNFRCPSVTLFPLEAQQSSAVICMSSVRFFYIFIGGFLRFASSCLFALVRCSL
jgi:hypothetical protein